MKEFRLKLILMMTSGGFDEYEAVSEIDFLIQTICSYKKADLLINKDITFSNEQKDTLENLVKTRILELIPMQYLVNMAYFMNKEFYVDKNVLIPRPETEILVQESLNIINNNLKSSEKYKILDIGTGSGCIPIMIAKNSMQNIEQDIKIWASDISSNALVVAQKNAKKHNVLDKINFVESNLFSNIQGKFDLIISNPPYIPPSMKDDLQKEVLLHEPQTALFAKDEKGIEFYEKIIRQAPSFLVQGGYVIFELGINQSEEVSALFFENNFENIEIIKDLSGIDRVIKAKINEIEFS